MTDRLYEFERIAFVLDMARSLPHEDAHAELRMALSSMADCPLRRWALRESYRILGLPIGLEVEMASRVQGLAA